MLNRPLLKYDKFINMLKGILGSGQQSTDNGQRTTDNGQQVWVANNFTNHPCVQTLRGASAVTNINYECVLYFRQG